MEPPVPGPRSVRRAPTASSRVARGADSPDRDPSDQRFRPRTLPIRPTPGTEPPDCAHYVVRPAPRPWERSFFPFEPRHDVPLAEVDEPNLLVPLLPGKPARLLRPCRARASSEHRRTIFSQSAPVSSSGGASDGALQAILPHQMSEKRGCTPNFTVGIFARSESLKSPAGFSSIQEAKPADFQLGTT